MIKKLILLSLLSLSTLAYGKMLNAIAIIVEGEPITTVEIQAIGKQYNITKEKATHLLIQDRLQKFAMKDIVVNETLVDDKIKMIAKQNHLSVPKMQKVLKEQGMAWGKYRLTIRKAIRKEKFFKYNIAKKVPEPTEEELKQYYQMHTDDFFLPEKIKVIEYSSKSEKRIQEFLKNKNDQYIKQKRVTKKTQLLNSALLMTLLNIKDGHFSKVLNAGDKFIVYRVLSKIGKVSMTYTNAKNAIVSKWKQQQQNRILKDYFEKIKTNADVQYLR